MIDLIIIVQDVDILDGENSLFRGDKTPYVTNGVDYMCLVRVEDESCIPTEVTILGTYDEVFANAEKKAIYDGIYNRIVSYMNEEGQTVNIEQPEKFGIFA